MKTSTIFNYGHQKRATVTAFLVALLFLCAPFRVFSQETVIYSEGFEANNGGYVKIIEPPDAEFPSLTGDGLWEWGVPTWISAHSGNKCWGTNFADNMPQSTSSILSPPISLAALNPATETARVSFWAQTDISMSGARGSFYVSSDGSNFTKLASFFIEMAGGWNRYEFNISDFIGGNIYLKFYIVDESGHRGFYVDDISISSFETTSHTRTLTLEANESSEGSCPWIYTWDGSKYAANNDIYSTARYAGSEYRDYLALSKPLIPENGKYKLQINEVASDESFTDFVQLNVIDHASDVKVAPDNFGHIFAYRPAHLIPPVTAVSNKGLDVLDYLKQDDRSGFNAYSQDYVDVDFGKADISRGGRLVIKMQGFLTGTGTPMPFVGPPAVVVQSLINGAWTEVGRMFPRFDWDVCAFDVSTFAIKPGAPVQLRLFSISHDRKYSNIDYVALEPGPEPAKTVSVAPLTSATFSGKSVLNLLNTANNQYANLKPGNHANLEFDVPGQTASTRSFIFTSEGYYIPRGSTYFVATWDGNKWVIHDGYSFSTIDETKTFDLSLYLPDPDNEMKVRIWQDYAEGYNYPAYIDFVGMQQDATVGTLAEATDLVNFVSIIPETYASDDIYFSLGDQVWDRLRWTEYKWSDITNNGVPVVSELYFATVNGLIVWKYTDPEDDPQLEASVQVWTGADGTGSLYWSPAPFMGTDTSVTYAGTPLVNGVTYYLRVKAYDLNNWNQWVEYSFVYDVPSKPGVYTTTPTSITTTGAASGGEIYNDGGASVSDRGVCWSTSSNPTISNSHTHDGADVGTFTSSITGLSGALGVTYYVRAYAINSVGVGYGPQASFTYGLPTVTTNGITGLTATDATSGGNVISDGNDPVSVRGVCWNTTGTPTTADDNTENGSGLGAFTSSITGLTGGTWYYARAYATNSYGTSYGGEMRFAYNEGALVVDAGDDATINSGDDYTLAGSATGSMLYPVTSFEWTTSGNGTFGPDATSTYTPTYTPGSTDISNGYVYITLTANCADPVTPSVSDEMELTISGGPVEDPPVSGTLARTPDADHVCEGTDVSAKLTAGSGGNGKDETEMRSHDGTEWSDWDDHTPEINISTTGKTGVEIRTRRLADLQPDAAFNTVSWVVDPATAGGEVTGGGPVCYGSHSTLLQLIDYTGSILRWEWSTDEISWNVIVNASDTCTAKNLLVDTYYRAVVQSGVCAVENSEAALLTMFKDYHISGYAGYENNPKTRLDGLKITLKKGGTPVGSPYTTGKSGFYQFTGLTNGTYSLEVASANAGGWLTWNGVNNTDYLLVLRHAGTGPYLPTDPPVVRIAADVKSPSTPPVITTADATAIQYAAKFGWAHPTPYFDIPKWVFSGVTSALALTGFELSCADVTRDIRGLCAGDVNGSYMPPSGVKNAEPTMELLHRGDLPISQEIVFPIRAEQAMEIGAITLMLDFDPSLIEITGVTMPDQGNEAPYYFVTENTLNIGWVSLNPLRMSSDQTMLLIHGRLINDKLQVTNDQLRIRFELNDSPLSELADANGNVLGNAKLVIADAGKTLRATQTDLVSVYPNPTSDLLNIEYLMNNDGMFNAELVSMSGIVLTKIDKSFVSAGLNKVTMDLRDIPNGAYMLKVFCGENHQTTKVIVTR